jgi:hypothetical protein
MKQSFIVPLVALCLGVGVVACNIAGQPCGWLNLSACTTGTGGKGCD